MLLVCDSCLDGKSKLFKIPTSAFCIEDAQLFVLKDYINMCLSCLLMRVEAFQGENEDEI